MSPISLTPRVTPNITELNVQLVQKRLSLEVAKHHSCNLKQQGFSSFELQMTVGWDYLYYIASNTPVLLVLRIGFSLF
jgi:hypothetical protein